MTAIIRFIEELIQGEGVPPIQHEDWHEWTPPFLLVLGLGHTLQEMVCGVDLHSRAGGTTVNCGNMRPFLLGVGEGDQFRDVGKMVLTIQNPFCRLNHAKETPTYDIDCERKFTESRRLSPSQVSLRDSYFQGYRMNAVRQRSKGQVARNRSEDWLGCWRLTETTDFTLTIEPRGLGSRFGKVNLFFNSRWEGRAGLFCLNSTENEHRLFWSSQNSTLNHHSIDHRTEHPTAHRRNLLWLIERVDTDTLPNYGMRLRATTS